MDYLFLDIETFGNKPSPDDVKVPKTYKNPDSILKYQLENVEKQWRENALDSMKSQILCISFAMNDDPITSVSVKGQNEQAMLNEFNNYLSQYNPLNVGVVAHNGAGFDFPFLWHRAFRDKLKFIYDLLNFKGKNDPRLLDTQEIWKGTNWKAYHSMDSVLTFLGLDGKGAVNGSMVHDMYLADKLDEIVEYCEDDVVKLRKMFWIFKELAD